MFLRRSRIVPKKLSSRKTIFSQVELSYESERAPFDRKKVFPKKIAHSRKNRFVFLENRARSFRFQKSRRKSHSAEKTQWGEHLVSTFVSIKKFSLVRDSNP